MRTELLIFKNTSVIRITSQDHFGIAKRCRQFADIPRGGLHCALYAHRTAGTLPNGTVRLSVSAFTSAADIDAFAHVLRSIVRG